MFNKLLWTIFILKVNSLRNITDPVKVAKGISGVLDIIDTTIGKEIPPTSGDLKYTTNILTDIIDIGTAANASVDSEVNFPSFLSAKSIMTVNVICIELSTYI